MAEKTKERRPGRPVFFEDQETDERPPDESVAEEKKDAIHPGTDGNARLGLLLEALRAFKQGNFSVRLTTGKNGVMGEIAEVFNDVVGLNESMANEIVRVSKIVGEEGQMTERASLGAVSGMWASQIDSVNALINNLAQPTAEVARVITAVAEGDLSQKMRLEVEGVPVKGEFLRIATITNTMVDQLNTFASEVTRVAREVGNEGKLGAQAEVAGVAGTWKDLTDNVNTLAANLTNQVRNIAEVTTAVAQGDLTRKITVEAQGEIMELKNTINNMVDQLSSFASEVTRVAKEVGNEGKLGAQAEVAGVAGTWKDLTDNVNTLAANLTNQVRNIAEVTTAVAQGDLTRKITVEAQGEIMELKNTINNMVDQLSSFGSEVTRVAKEVGVEGKLGAQAEVPGVAGTWKELTDNVNMLAANLTNQVRNIAQVSTAIANGDLTQKITVEAQGEIMELKDTLNKMVDSLSTFGSEVTRVAKEVGVEGKLGAQAEVPGVAGTWKELTDNVNMLAANLTNQVRNIAQVSTAIANGDLTQKITVEAQGEIMELKDTLNGMVDNLNAVIGDINSVMAMVGEGNLTRLIKVEAAGEFASMVNGINGTLESLRGIINELAEAGTSIGAVSQNMLSAGQEMNALVTQLSSSVEQIAEGARTQAQQIAEASRESEGIGKIASNTATRAENMRQMAEGANKAATEGSQAMEETTKSTNLMLEGSKESAERINSLSKSSEQIREVIDIIRDIATQTNILAINAAIEAVRAGRQGKGFTVVAEEVKTLSADSKNQAKNISDLVQSILKETEGAVTTINTMAENVESGRRSTEQTSGVLSEIISSVGGTTKEAQEISVAAGQQKNSIDTVSQSLDKISGIAADTSTSGAQLVESTKTLRSNVQELAATSQTLGDMAQKFQQTVGRFTIGEVVSTEPTPAVAPRKAKSTSKQGAKTPEKVTS